MPKVKKAPMKRAVVKFLLMWLMDCKFPHMLRWTNKENKEFSILFLNKRNKKWDEKYLDLFKAFDNISPTKAAKYRESSDYDKECKKRCKSNLQKLCNDNVLQKIREETIKESIVKIHYRFTVKLDSRNESEKFEDHVVGEYVKLRTDLSQVENDQPVGVQSINSSTQVMWTDLESCEDAILSSSLMDITPMDIMNCSTHRIATNSSTHRIATNSSTQLNSMNSSTWMEATNSSTRTEATNSTTLMEATNSSAWTDATNSTTRRDATNSSTRTEATNSSTWMDDEQTVATNSSTRTNSTTLGGTINVYSNEDSMKFSEKWYNEYLGQNCFNYDIPSLDMPVSFWEDFIGITDNDENAVVDINCNRAQPSLNYAKDFKNDSEPQLLPTFEKSFNLNNLQNFGGHGFGYANKFTDVTKYYTDKSKLLRGDPLWGGQCPK